MSFCALLERNSADFSFTVQHDSNLLPPHIPAAFRITKRGAFRITKRSVFRIAKRNVCRIEGISHYKIAFFRIIKSSVSYYNLPQLRIILFHFSYFNITIFVL